VNPIVQDFYLGPKCGVIVDIGMPVAGVEIFRV